VFCCVFQVFDDDVKVYETKGPSIEEQLIVILMNYKIHKISITHKKRHFLKLSNFSFRFEQPTTWKDGTLTLQITLALR
jgi:hypothetical protein